MRLIEALIIRIKSKAIQIYFVLLFGLLLFIYSPSFFHPPRSDHWPAFYFFYRMDMLAGPHKWLHLLVHDPLINATFRPLAFLILYFEHSLFGAEYIYYQLINFSLYFISILLLYKLALDFCKSKLLIIIFLTIFACLFSHFDIVAWSFNTHIILSFCFFLSGFILYLDYLKSKRKIILFCIVVLFLLGMLFYEVFLFWPLAIVLLSNSKSIIEEKKSNNTSLCFPYLWVVVPLYVFYIGLFLLDRSIKVYRGPGINLGNLFYPGTVILNIFTVFFNNLYNNFIVNLLPQLAFPLEINENLNMGGFIVAYEFSIEKLIFIGGGIFLSLILFLLIYFLRKKNVEAVKALTFFVFLLFSELFVLFHCKSLVNSIVYSLTQFRFQYIPNALLIFIIIILIDKFIVLSRKNIFVICLSASLILVLNIQISRLEVLFLSNQLSPLNKVMLNIKQGMREGIISSKNKFFLNDEIAESLPLLCWNREMGERCMRGTYQWIFSKEQIKYFSDFDKAKWTMDKDNFNIISK